MSETAHPIQHVDNADWWRLYERVMRVAVKPRFADHGTKKQRQDIYTDAVRKEHRKRRDIATRREARSTP